MIEVLHNPIDMLFQAIEKVNDISATMVFVTQDQCDGNWGYTQKNEDGTYIIGIAVELSWQDSLEIIAHEAAHIMAKSHEKPEEEQHDEEWEFWFDNIQREYEQEIKQLEREEKKGNEKRTDRRHKEADRRRTGSGKSEIQTERKHT